MFLDGLEWVCYVKKKNRNITQFGCSPAFSQSMNDRAVDGLPRLLSSSARVVRLNGELSKLAELSSSQSLVWEMTETSLQAPYKNSGVQTFTESLIYPHNMSNHTPLAECWFTSQGQLSVQAYCLLLGV